MWEEQYERSKKETEQEVQKHNRQVAQTMDIKFGTNEPTKKVKVRVVASQELTLLGLRTAIYNYLFAKQH